MKFAGTLFLVVAFSSIGTLVNATQGRSQDTQAASCPPVIVQIAKIRGQVSYTIDSKPATDPLRALGGLVQERGETCPVVVLVTWDASLKEISDLELTASKAGFKTVRTFVVKNGFMSEIKFGKSILFSKHPPL
jgi:hypothetical protein